MDIREDSTKKDPEIASSDIDSSTHDDGTSAQSQLGARAARRHFFSSLDAQVAEAVKNDAERVLYSEEEERVVMRKVDKRILPLVICSFVFNQFDRTNIGNAHVLTSFNENFGIHDNNQWTLALSIFYVGYCLLEIPANILQRKIGANRFFFLSLSFWGLCSLSFVYAKGYGALLALRVLLGIGEAGFYAGIIYYLSFWYKRKEMAFRISLGMTGTLPGAIGGFIAFGLVRAKTSLLDGWQFLFLVEAIPTILMASVLLLFLPSFPFTATFLTPREKAIAQARLNRDHRPTSHGGMNGWQGFKAILHDLNTWLLMLIYVGCKASIFVDAHNYNLSPQLYVRLTSTPLDFDFAWQNIGTATSTYFLPTLINALGFTAIDAQGLTVAPYAFGYFLTIGQAFHSDHTRDRGWHVMFSSAVSCIGYIILATCAEKSVGASYFALFFVIGGNFSLFPLVMSWAANTLSPTSKRGVGTAFIVSVSNCVSIAAPQFYFDPEDSFRKGHGIAAGCLFVSFSAAFILRTRLLRLNKHKETKLAAYTEQEKDPGDGELADTDPRFKYMI